VTSVTFFGGIRTKAAQTFGSTNLSKSDAGPARTNSAVKSVRYRRVFALTLGPCQDEESGSRAAEAAAAFVSPSDFAAAVLHRSENSMPGTHSGSYRGYTLSNWGRHS